MIRVDADAVHLPPYCIEQSTRAPGDDDREEATSTSSSSSCFPRRRRRQQHAPPPTLDARELTIPASRLVGAEVVVDSHVRVWYTEEEEKQQEQDRTLRGYVCPPPLRVRVSAPVDADGNAGAVVSAIRALARRRTSAQQQPQPPQQQPTRVVAIVNPASGRGRSLRDFEREARPLLERAAGLGVTLLPTQRPGHARELAQGLDLENNTTPIVLAVVGGDGTLHEVINGLLTRPDWRRVCGVDGDSAPRPLLAHIPCGSGNGVAVSCGLRDAATAAVAIAKGCCRAPMDVTSVLVRTVDGRLPTTTTTTTTTTAPANNADASLTRTFCALSVVYGMMANLDIKTEPLRFLGDARFTLGGAIEILGAKSYACRGAWVGPPCPAASAQDGAAAAGFLAEEDVGDEADEADGGGYSPPPPPAGENAPLAGGRARSCDLLAAVAAAAESAAPQPPAANSDLALLTDGGPPLPLLSRLAQAHGGRLPEKIPQRASLQSLGWRSLPVGGRRGEGEGEEGRVHMFSAVAPPYVAGNYRLNPLGALSSGAMRQMWVPGHSVRGVSGRLKSLALQDAAAEGRHLDAPPPGGERGLMRHAPAAALALEPLAPAGETWVQLDGEVVRGAVPKAALWAETHKGLLTVVVRPGHREEA